MKVELHELEPALSLADLAVWVDPIDGTWQYIRGGEEAVQVEEGELPTAGLGCVTVLIGLFQLSTGRPLLGVVNQPFWSAGAGRQHWAVREGRGWVQSAQPAAATPPRSPPRLLVGGSEDPALLALLAAQFQVVKAGGAGNKLLLVTLGLADAYLGHKAGVVFQWDTCGPHALLAAQGGSLVDCRQFQEIRWLLLILAEWKVLEYNLIGCTDTVWRGRRGTRPESWPSGRIT